MSGFNREPPEFGGGGREFGKAEEHAPFQGNAAPEEYGSAEPTPKQRARKAQRRHTTLTSVAGFAVAATVAVAGTVAFTSTPAEANLTAKAMHTSVSYEVEVLEGEELDVVLYNDFVRFSAPLEAGKNSGVFEDLLSNVQYTIAVVGETSFGEKTVTSTTVRTTAAPDPVTEWRGIVNDRCLCGVDGYYHFTMDFTDENAYYSDFEASVTDRYGTVSYCTFTEDLHAEQRIDICNAVQLYGVGRLTITCISRESGEEGLRILVDKTFDI